MNEPLASAAGNAVEVRNAVDYLTGAKRDPRLDRVTMALGAELLALSGLAPDALAGEAALKRALESGAAAERFERMVAGLGGPKISSRARMTSCLAPRSSSTRRLRRLGSSKRSTCARSGSRWSARRRPGARRRYDRPRRRPDRARPDRRRGRPRSPARPRPCARRR